MENLTDRIDPATFFERLATAFAAVLMLDYDGTLAPFREDRDRAVPYPGVREVVERLVGIDGIRTVLISGRPVRDVIRLMDLDGGVEVWGTHGWERRLPEGTYEEPELPPGVEDALDRAERFLREELEAGPRCERKPASVAFHVRSLPPDRARSEEARVEEGWSEWAERDRLAIERFDGGLELRVEGRDKGDAVTEILRETRSGVPVAYLGDDRTDEDAFRALDERGLRVLVRPELRETGADWWLRPPEELLAFLERWARTVG